MIVLQAQQLKQMTYAIFMAAGAAQPNAERVAEALVDANLAGHDSHGVARIPQYLQAIAAGQLDPAARPAVLKETALSLLLDGKWSFGQVGAQMCMQEAIRRAKTHGMAIAALVRAYHIGRLGEYSEMAHDAGMIALVTTGGLGGRHIAPGAGMAPYGGARAVLGTNPLSFGFPAGAQPPVMADFATSTVAMGKVNLARAKGEALPPNCILDRHGNPTTDPNDFYDGGVLLPFGGHKGYGLAVVVELLSQALTGSDTCGDAKESGGLYMLAGNVFLVLDPALFRPKEDYGAAADAIIQKIKAVPPAAGFSEVLVPGEPEQRSKARRRQEGVGIADGTWKALQEQAAKLNLNLAELAGMTDRPAS
jgi:LDH2 family malate/lactate/ureidoglycolate dehydrogenase